MAHFVSFSSFETWQIDVLFVALASQVCPAAPPWWWPTWWLSLTTAGRTVCLPSRLFAHLLAQTTASSSSCRSTRTQQLQRYTHSDLKYFCFKTLHRYLKYCKCFCDVSTLKHWTQGLTRSYKNSLWFICFPFQHAAINDSSIEKLWFTDMIHKI